jgi:hypothetical protein
MPAAPRLYCNVGSERTLDNSRYLLLRLWECDRGRDGVIIQVVWVHVSLQEHWVVRQSPSVGVVAEGCLQALHECGILSCSSSCGRQYGRYQEALHRRRVMARLRYGRVVQQARRERYGEVLHQAHGEEVEIKSGL